MYLRKVGPRLMVIEENQIMKRPKATHWGLSLTISRVSRSPSSTSVGSTGLAFRTVVRRFTWMVLLLLLRKAGIGNLGADWL